MQRHRDWVGFAVLFTGIGCGGEDAGEVFEPGPPGRAAGIRAVVEIDGQEFESNEVEIALRSVNAENESDAEDRAASAAGIVPPNRVVGPVPAAPSSFAAKQRFATRVERVSRLANAPAPAEAECEGGIAPGTDVTEMGTLEGRICYTDVSYSVGSLVVEDSLTTRIWYAREGIYYQADLGQSAYYPPDFGHVGFSFGAGCFNHGEDKITTAYLDSLKTVSLSFGFGPFSFGYTFYVLPGQGLVRALGYSTGWGISASLLPFPISFGFSVSTASENLVGPRAVRGWSDQCLQPLQRMEGVSYATGYNALTFAADNLEAIAAEPADDYRGVLMKQAAESSLPLMRLVGRPTGGGLSENIPAGTNADFFDDFLSRSGGDLCTDCPNTSLDHILTGFNNQLANSEEIDEILQTGFTTVERVTESMPQMMQQASAQLSTAAVNDLVFEVVADMAAEARGDENRYVAQDLHVVEVQVEEEARLDVTASEIAELIGVDTTALEGATVTFSAEPQVDEASFVLTDGVAAASLTPSKAAPILIKVEVDLSTAEGPFPGGVEDWVVRPRMRLLKVAAGPPAFAYLAAPGTTVSGAPVGLSAAVLDEGYNVIDAPFDATFFDADGEIGAAQASLGAAEYRYRPAPSTPQITAFASINIDFGDGTSGPGYEIVGTGFSTDAIVEIDDTATEDMFVVDSRSILVAATAVPDGSHTVVVANPESVVSEPFVLEL